MPMTLKALSPLRTYLQSSMDSHAALKVLLKLEMTGRISAAKPQSLEDVLKNVNRIDLVKKVKDFSKKDITLL